MAWHPESSCAINENLKEGDRKWIAGELIFYFINMPFRAVEFENITSKFHTVASTVNNMNRLNNNYTAKHGRLAR